MKRFLSLQGQANLGAFIAFLAMCTIFGIVCVSAPGASGLSLIVGRVLLFVVIFGLTVLAGVISIPEITSEDLAFAAEQCEKEEKRRIQEILSLRISPVSYRKLGRWTKITYITVIGMGAVIMVYGVADFLGYGPVFRLPRRGGGWETIPRWMSGGMAFFFGFAAILCSQLLKYQVRDLIDDAIAKATNIVKGDFGGKVH